MGDQVTPQGLLERNEPRGLGERARRALDVLGIGSGARWLFLAITIPLLLRLAVIALSPDSEADAYGHFRIAEVLATDPGNLHVHWVWLPAPHYAIAALVRLGLTHDALRVLATLAFAASPLLLLCYATGRADGGARVATLAAILWALAPVSNRIATTAQPETGFALLMLGAVWALETRHGALAGVLLAVGCLTRYECWAAVAVLGLVAPFTADRKGHLVAVALPLVAVAGWVVLRRFADGNWLWFVWHTWRFSERVREDVGLPFVVDSFLVPLWLPLSALGPLVLLAPWRLRRVTTVAWAGLAGILVMLAATYLLRGIPALDRYLVVLVPFLCVAAARVLLSRAAVPVRFQGAAVRATVAALGAMTLAHLAWAIIRSQAMIA